MKSISLILIGSAWLMLGDVPLAHSQTFYPPPLYGPSRPANAPTQQTPAASQPQADYAPSQPPYTPDQSQSAPSQPFYSPSQQSYPSTQPQRSAPAPQYAPQSQYGRGQPQSAPAQQYAPNQQQYAPYPPGGYVYNPPTAYPRTPVFVPAYPPAWGYPAVGGYPYRSGYSYGYGANPGYIPRAATPPYGFGSPNYNGYNDPYLSSYGPGVREFIRWGGADFYGW